METLKDSRRWLVIKWLLITSIGTFIAALALVAYGITMTGFVSYFMSFGAMTSAVIVGHYVSAPSKG